MLVLIILEECGVVERLPIVKKEPLVGNFIYILLHRLNLTGFSLLWLYAIGPIV